MAPHGDPSPSGRRGEQLPVTELVTEHGIREVVRGEREALDGDEHLPVTDRRQRRPHHTAPFEVASIDLERDLTGRLVRIRRCHYGCTFADVAGSPPGR